MSEQVAELSGGLYALIRGVMARLLDQRSQMVDRAGVAGNYQGTFDKFIEGF